jgi:hypothetical protein
MQVTQLPCLEAKFVIGLKSPTETRLVCRRLFTVVSPNQPSLSLTVSESSRRFLRSSRGEPAGRPHYGLNKRAACH